MGAPVKYKVLFCLHRHDRELDPQLQCRIKWGSSRFIVTVNTGYRVNPERWDSEQQRCAPGSFHGARRVPAATINAEIFRYASVVDEVFTEFSRQGVFPSVPDVRAAVQARLSYQSEVPASEDVFAAFDQFCVEQGTKNAWTDGTHTKWRVFRRHLAAWRPGLHWSDFDDAGLTSFVTYLREKRGHKNSTVRRMLSFLRWFLGWAVSKGYYSSEAFRDFRPKFRGQDLRPVIFLTWEELMRLWEWQPEAEPVLMEQVRDIFCFCCFTSLRFSDVMNLCWPDVGPESFKLTTVKTAEPLEIQLNRWSSELLWRYVDAGLPGERVFPLISNQVFNRNLHDLCHICEIDEPVHVTWYRGSERFDEVHPKWELVSSHCGRRTFICNALAMGISPTVVMQWTGHEDYKAMRPYIAVSQDTKAEAMALFDKT